jgi:hypothetical protein
MKSHETKQILDKSFVNKTGRSVLNNACFDHGIIWFFGRPVNNDYSKFVQTCFKDNEQQFLIIKLYL